MKKKKIIFVILSAAFILGGCAGAVAGETKETAGEAETLQEQITSLTNEFKNYIMTPTMADYVLVSDEQLNPVLTEAEESLILEIQSNGREAYENMEVTVIFYDAEDNIAATTSLFMPLILPNVKHMNSFTKPQTNEGQPIAYENYDFQFKALPVGTELINYSDKIELVSNKDSNGAVLAKITNTSDQTIASVITYIQYYKDGKLIDSSESDSYGLLPKEREVLYFQGPYGANYSILPFDDYKVYVAAAVTKTMQDNPPEASE